MCFPCCAWCSAELEFIQNSSVCVIIAPKALALKEIHHIPDRSRPLHSSPKELPEVQSDFQPGLFCLVLAFHCPLTFGGQAIASRGKAMYYKPPSFQGLTLSSNQSCLPFPSPLKLEKAATENSIFYISLCVYVYILEYSKVKCNFLFNKGCHLI